MLPEMALRMAGDWAVWAWGVIVVFSFLCACVFGELCIRHPGDAGVSSAVEAAFGRSIRNLASLFLILSVPFGSAAVLLTAGDCLLRVTGWESAVATGYGIVAVCVLILCCRVDFLGGVLFVLSSVSAAVLLSGALTSLALFPLPFVVSAPFDPDRFGHTVLILLWAVFGWEIIGNYTRDVRDLRRTTVRAVALSFVVIATIYIAVAMAIQWSDGGLPGRIPSVAGILHPLFGAWSERICAFLGAGLCATTWLLYTGGTSRLMAALSEERLLPGFFGWRSRVDVPVAATFAIGIVNCAVLFLVGKDVIDFQSIVGITNCFMSAYALIGALAAIRLPGSRAIAIAAGLLAAMFVVMLVFWSPGPILILILVLCAFFVMKGKSNTKLKQY